MRSWTLGTKAATNCVVVDTGRSGEYGEDRGRDGIADIRNPVVRLGAITGTASQVVKELLTTAVTLQSTFISRTTSCCR